MKIVSISGSGRTGSTLVSLLLSQNQDVFNLGQLRDFWRSYASNETCTCGQSLRNCGVWSRAMHQAFGPDTKDKVRQMQEGMSAFIAGATVLTNWGDKAALVKLRDRHSEYLNNFGIFLRGLTDVVGTDNFIDSSKSPEFALAYSLIDGVDIRVLNLVRDPRAVASSWEKRHNADMAVGMSKVWVQRQSVLGKWASVLGADFSLLKYEDFTRNARSSIEQALRWAGVDATVDHFDKELHASVSWDRQHLFPPANEAILTEKRKAFEIVEASAWRNGGNPRLHRSVVQLARPLMVHLGYDLAETMSMSAVNPELSGNQTTAIPSKAAVAPARRSSQGQEYVFLICSERSGSNLISAILNSHSLIGATPPYHLCRDIGLNWHTLLDAGAQSTVWAKMRQLMVQRVGQLKSPAAGAELDKWLAALRQLSFPFIARHVYSHSSGLGDKQYIFVKENNIHKMLFFILKYFPKARFVFQVRDPRDYLLSAMNLKEGGMGNKFGSSYHAMQIWRDDQLGGLAALAHLGRDRVWFQRYEDLLAKPEKVLGGLSAFLGVQFEKGMLEFNQTEYAASLAVAGGPRENLTKPLIADNAAKYRTGLSVEQIRMVEIHVGDLMERFGYRRDYPDTRDASKYEVLWSKFLEPFERVANAAVEPFYADKFATAVGRGGSTLVPGYEKDGPAVLRS